MLVYQRVLYLFNIPWTFIGSWKTFLDFPISCWYILPLSSHYQITRTKAGIYQYIPTISLSFPKHMLILCLSTTCEYLNPPNTPKNVLKFQQIKGKHTNCMGSWIAKKHMYIVSKTVLYVCMYIYMLTTHVSKWSKIMCIYIYTYVYGSHVYIYILYTHPLVA